MDSSASPRTQKSVAFDLVDILPQRGIDFVRVQGTMQQLLVAILDMWISKAYNLWTLGHVRAQIKLTYTRPPAASVQ